MIKYKSELQDGSFELEGTKDEIQLLLYAIEQNILVDEKVGRLKAAQLGKNVLQKLKRDLLPLLQEEDKSQMN